MDDTRAFVLGTVAGLAEIVTEKVSLEALLSPDLEKGALRYIVKNVLAEGSEEGASDLINYFADDLYDLISGQEASKWHEAINSYRAQGYTESEAFGRALADRAGEVGLDMLGGALSGGVMAGGSLAINAYQNSEGFKDKQSGKDLADMKLTPDKYAAMVENGLNAPEGSEVRRTAEAIQEKLDAGNGVKQTEYGKLWRLTNEAIDEAIDEAIRGDNAQRGAESVPNASEGNYTTESANTALAKADEASTGNAALDDILRAISEAGAVTNAQARTIMADRTMLDALSEITGIDLSSVGQPANAMTASEQRTTVKNAAIQAAETLNEQKNSAPEAETWNNTRLSEKDLDNYVRTGKRESVRNAKKNTLAVGESPILTTLYDIKEFIRDAIHGKKTGETKGYGKVGTRLAEDVRAINPDVEISGYYLELVTDELKHAYNQHNEPKQSGNVALTEEDFESLPDYIDNYDRVISVEKYNNKTKIRLAKQIHGVDYAIILETVSKDRGSLHPQNVIGISEKQYNEKYNRGNAGSRRAVMDNATQPNTSPHTDYVSSTISNIPQTSANSQEGNAAVSPESVNTALTKADEASTGNAAQNEQNNTASTEETVRPDFNILQHDDAAAISQAQEKAYSAVFNSDRSVEISRDILDKYETVNRNPVVKLKDAVKEFYESHLLGKKSEWNSITAFWRFRLRMMARRNQSAGA